MKRSKRFEKLEKMPINQDGFAYEWEEAGLVAMDSPYDPLPGVKVENGVIVEMDGIRREDVLHPKDVMNMNLKSMLLTVLQD